MGKLKDLQITLVVSTLNKSDQNLISLIAEKILDEANKIPTYKNKVKVIKISTKLSAESILLNVVKQIEKALDTYEEGDNTIENWNLDFEIGKNFHKINKQQLISFHSKLVINVDNNNKIKLLLFSELGRFYKHLKEINKIDGNWGALCRELNLCTKTTNRYIDFYDFYLSYPRILISQLSFETIVSNASRLLGYMNQNHDFHNPLALRSVEIKSDLFINAEHFPNVDQPFNEFWTARNWNANWEICHVLDEEKDIA